MTSQSKSVMTKIAGPLYWVLLVIMLFPFDIVFGEQYQFITPPVALFTGLVFAFIFGIPYPTFNKKLSKYLLQASVVGLGFGMNLQKSLQSGADGMLFTVVSVIGVMIIGVWLGRYMGIAPKTSYLISSGTAICGGSAIAAVGPVMKADQDEMAVSLGVIFILNAIALFIFPPLGHLFGLSQTQFGTWAAIAIHDTSSVVGAGAAYDQMYFPGSTEACDLATLIKCTRALWIIPLALVTMFLFREKGSKISIPWFIFIFILAMVVNTYVALPDWFVSTMVWIARRGMVVTLFLIGASLSLSTVRQVGVKPLILAVVLWIVISISSLIVVLNTIA